MVKMMKAIKHDVESGQELMESGRKCTRRYVLPINKSHQIDQGSSSSDDKIDYSVLYAKV
jgi:hypothetical protein